MKGATLRDLIAIADALGFETRALRLELEAELFAPSRAAGLIREGQRVRLKFDAFPYQKFGWGEGEVARVSTTIYRPEDLPIDLGLKEPVFRIAVRLDRASVGAYGEEFALQPGMTLSADIVQERRALWRMLFDFVGRTTT